MTKPAYTHIISILDTSGSMHGIIKDLVGSFDEFCSRQKEVPGDVTCSVYTFNTEVTNDASFVDVIAKSVTLPTRTTGGTALYDAIGHAVIKEGVALDKTPEDLRPSKVIVTILTDGEENSSREFTQSKVKSMLEHQQTKYGWEVIFMGANIDAVSVGASIGVKRQNSVQYEASSVGTKSVYKGLTDRVLRSRV